MCPRRWQRLRERERDRCSASSSWKRAVPVLLNMFWVRSEVLSCCTEVGLRGLMDKVLVQGWGQGLFTAAGLPCAVGRRGVLSPRSGLAPVNAFTCPLQGTGRAGANSSPAPHLQLGADVLTLQLH